MFIKIAKPKDTKFALLNFHYAKCIPAGMGVSFNVFNDDKEWCGCIVFGNGMAYPFAKPLGLVIGQVWELQRVALNGKQGHNKTVQAIAACIKYIRKNFPLVKCLVSYADKFQNHIGTIYQAGNWIYTGEFGDAMMYKHIVTGKEVRQRTFDTKSPAAQSHYVRAYSQAGSKLRYVMLLDKKDKRLYNLFEEMRKPYPKKNENSKT